MLVELGYKEIEISFPSASKSDFEFTRRLIETPGAVPDDVWLQVLSPCREDLIRQTVHSMKGARKGILHLYLATSECFRRVVFGMSEEQSLQLAVKCTKFARSITKDVSSDTEWLFEFSPETFSDTDPDYAARVCKAVAEAWGPTEKYPIIFNLPATVEMATPNVFADQIEYFCQQVPDRATYVVSIHPHNDRGCAIAAAELAQMAGADRVEGTLFGNGERSGNVDLVTLALNLYTQGVSPGIDFSDMNQIVKVVEESTKIQVHMRWPYAGKLVMSAFSGTHQDAIKKGFMQREAHKADDLWVMPYLPLDPQDIGRNYDAVIRVNSQSGKGGASWIILRNLELDLPRGLQLEFSRAVQKVTEDVSRELRQEEVLDLFKNAYHISNTPRISLIDYDITTDRSRSQSTEAAGSSSSRIIKRFHGTINIDGVEHLATATGADAINSLANALSKFGIHLELMDYKQQALRKGKFARAATYIQCKSVGVNQHVVWGVGIHVDAVRASLIALLNAASSVSSSSPSLSLRCVLLRERYSNYCNTSYHIRIVAPCAPSLSRKPIDP